jgi:hypothetical protein
MNDVAPARSPDAAPPSLDRVGMAGSLLCAVHCALLPMLFVVLPSVGLALALSDRVELGFVVFASLVGATSLVRGYRAHRAAAALLLLGPGLTSLWLGATWPPLHHAPVPHALAMATGGGLVAVAHYLNLHYTRRARG